MPTYTYGPCTTEECELKEQAFKYSKKMSEYQDPQPCPCCGTMYERATNDWPKAIAFKGPGWFNTGGYGANYKPVGDIMKNPTAKK